MKTVKIKTIADVHQFEARLVSFWMKKLGEVMPVTIEDSRQTDSVEEATKEQRLSLEAFQELHGFNPNDKEEVLNQYHQGEIKKVVFPLPPVIFAQSGTAPSGVNYLKVTISAHQTDDKELQHLLSEKSLSRSN